MQAGSVLLAAGRGERLRPITDRVPKAALPMLDVPLGAFGLARVSAAAPPTMVNLRHLGQKVTLALRPWAPGGVVGYLEEEPDAYGGAGTLRALKDRLEPRFLTHNSDVLTDLDLSDLLESHRASGAKATLAGRIVASGADFELDAELPAAVIDRRVAPNEAGALFLGIAAFDRDALEGLDDRLPLGLTEGLIAPLIGRGEAALFPHAGYWLDVGTPRRYLEASLDLLEGRGQEWPAGLGPPGAVVGVEGGPAYVGPGADVPDDALGPGAIVLARGRVEAGARIEGALVMPDEVVPAGAVVKDAVWFGGRALPT